MTNAAGNCAFGAFVCGLVDRPLTPMIAPATSFGTVAVPVGAWNVSPPCEYWCRVVANAASAADASPLTVT